MEIGNWIRMILSDPPWACWNLPIVIFGLNDVLLFVLTVVCIRPWFVVQKISSRHVEFRAFSRGRTSGRILVLINKASHFLLVIVGIHQIDALLLMLMLLPTMMAVGIVSKCSVEKLSAIELPAG